VQDAEASIAQLEKMIAASQEGLAKASAGGDASAIQRLSQELAKAQKDLEQKLHEWEEASKTLDETEKAFALRLEDA